MRQHSMFVATLAGAVVAVGALMIYIGASEPQARARGGAHLDLGGNEWFLAGLCVAAVSGITCVAAITSPSRALFVERLGLLGVMTGD